MVENSHSHKEVTVKPNETISKQSTLENVEESLPSNPIADSTYQTAERSYYHRGNCFIKRSLRPTEYITTMRGTKHIPRLPKERLQNEAAALSYVRRVSNIPVPTLYGAFEIDDSFMVITEYIDGVAMVRLSEDEKRVVDIEIEQHLATLRGIKSDTIGGPSGIVIPPYRVMLQSENDEWSKKVCKDQEFVFCHNDLSQHNIIVDPETLKIRAIIDWEYAGFFPANFEMPFYKRPGPSVALNDEKDDSAELLAFMRADD
ncbi:hypothetical protein N7528_005793 [Penicillium herquei]|nr:hypothetical protein N7528_005793 [Penicillium herquei]